MSGNIRNGEPSFRLTSTGGSSSKYGPCEVCSEPVREVWRMTKARTYDRPGQSQGETQMGDLFGHYGCLESKAQKVISDYELQRENEGVAQ